MLKYGNHITNRIFSLFHSKIQLKSKKQSLKIQTMIMLSLRNSKTEVQQKGGGTLIVMYLQTEYKTP